MGTRDSPIDLTAVEATSTLISLNIRHVYSTIEKQVAFSSKQRKRQVEEVYAILIRLNNMKPTKETFETAEKYLAQILVGQRTFQCLSQGLQELYLKNVYEYAFIKERENASYSAIMRAEDMALTAAYIPMFLTSIINNSYLSPGNKDNWFLWREKEKREKDRVIKDVKTCSPQASTSPPLTPYRALSLPIQIRSSLPFDPIRQANFEIARDNTAHTNSGGNTANGQGHIKQNIRLPSIRELLQH